MQLELYGSNERLHCLSRAFLGHNKEGSLAGEGLQPTVIEDLLRQHDFPSFRNKLEHGPHKEIPNGIGGDFMQFTAPNDPLFYLHHR